VIVATAKLLASEPLPARFEDLVQLMPPQAINDDVCHANTVEVIDRLMAAGKLSKGQSLYLETLVQLVEIYEAEHHAIDTADLSGLDSLRHLLDENDMNASDLARLLGVHASLGSKILRGERALTVDHLRKLSAWFKVSPELFLDPIAPPAKTSKGRRKAR
jgi:HTH-type transcriptional regulator / antitoxin HigA